MNRRESLSLLAIGGAGTLISSIEADWLAVLSAAAPMPRPKTATSFPPNSIIRTLVEDVAPDTVTGPILFDDLSLDLPDDGAGHLRDIDALTIEARAAAHHGVACLVDRGHSDFDVLRQISVGSALPVVASVGLSLQRINPEASATMTVDQIADDLTRDAFAKRPGTFVMVPRNPELCTEEMKWCQAVSTAHRRTGLPVFAGQWRRRSERSSIRRDAGLRLLDLFESAAVRIQNVAIDHFDADLASAIRIAKRGAFVGLNPAKLAALGVDPVATILAIADAGLIDRLLLLSDAEPLNDIQPRLAQTALTVGPALLKAGMAETTLRTVLIDNPRRFLAFVPR